MGARAAALDADRGTVTISRKQASGEEGGGQPAAGGGGGKTVLEEVDFGRCLLALGSRPRPPPPGFVDPGVWGGVAMLGERGGSGGGADREELSREVAAGKSVTVVGSSWQALELACWLQERRGGSPEKVTYCQAPQGLGGFVILLLLVTPGVHETKEKQTCGPSKM